MREFNYFAVENQYLIFSYSIYSTFSINIFKAILNQLIYLDQVSTESKEIFNIYCLVLFM